MIFRRLRYFIIIIAASRQTDLATSYTATDDVNAQRQVVRAIFHSTGVHLYVGQSVADRASRALTDGASYTSVTDTQ